MSNRFFPQVVSRGWCWTIFRNLLLACLMTTSVAWAHKPSDSYLTFEITPDTRTVDLRWDIALRDLDFALDLDTDQSADLTWQEVLSAQDRIQDYALKHLMVRANSDKGPLCPLKPGRQAQLDQHSDGTYIVLWLKTQCDVELKDGIWVNYQLFFNLDPTHRGLAQWSADQKPLGSALFKPEAPALALGVKPLSALSVAADYIKDGVWHIWIGIDHILFLVSLLLPAVMLRTDQHWRGVPKLSDAVKDIVKVVTAFTLAHSITLSLAALKIVQLPSVWVESIIALSVVVAALNNLRGAVHSKRWMMAFGFGLLHGFGFASVLADLGLPTQLLALALLSFNIGVEIGQLSIVVAVMPIAFLLRNTKFYRLGILQCGSLVVAIIAAVWTVERATGIKYLPF